MEISIVGGHGQIGLLLARQLADRGDAIRALIRNPTHADDVRAAGAELVAYDLEGPDEMPLDGSDAVVFAAGAGPGSGAARKWTVDRDGATKLAKACERWGIARYVMLSAMGLDRAGSTGDEVFDAYLEAKRQADEAVLASGLDVTVIRPGRLTDEPPTGGVDLAPSVPPCAIARADVAAVLAEVLHAPGLSGVVAELVGGSTPVRAAVAALGDSSAPGR